MPEGTPHGGARGEQLLPNALPIRVTGPRVGPAQGPSSQLARRARPSWCRRSYRTPSRWDRLRIHPGLPGRDPVLSGLLASEPLSNELSQTNTLVIRCPLHQDDDTGLFDPVNVLDEAAFFRLEGSATSGLPAASPGRASCSAGPRRPGTASRRPTLDGRSCPGSPPAAASA